MRCLSANRVPRLREHLRATRSTQAGTDCFAQCAGACYICGSTSHRFIEADIEVPDLPVDVNSWGSSACSKSAIVKTYMYSLLCVQTKYRLCHQLY